MSLIKIKNTKEQLKDLIDSVKITEKVKITVESQKSKTFEISSNDYSTDTKLYEAIEDLSFEKKIKFIEEKTTEEGLLVKVYQDLSVEQEEDIEEFDSFKAYKDSVEAPAEDSEIESQTIEVEEKDDELDEETEETSEEEADNNHNSEEALV